MRPTNTPDPIDQHVGNRIRRRRTALRLSQSHLGDGVGLTFQQIQKYETGANRVSCSRLYQFARLLNVEVDYFFDELPWETVATYGFEPVVQAGKRLDSKRLQEAVTSGLLDAYFAIPDGLRGSMLDLIVQIAAREEAASPSP